MRKVVCQYAVRRGEVGAVGAVVPALGLGLFVVFGVNAGLIWALAMSPFFALP